MGFGLTGYTFKSCWVCKTVTRRIDLINCKECGSEHVQKRGYNNNRTKQRIECQECGSWGSVEIEVEPSFKKEHKNVLVFDIETMIKKAWLFRAGKQYVNAKNFIDSDKMICWSAKVLGGSDIFGDCLTSDEAIKKDHSRIVKSLWDLMKNFDITVSHNGINFDIPMINTFFLKQSLGLPNRLRNIDTYQIAQREFRFESNSLDFICRELGLNSGKHETNQNLWIKCYDGDSESLKYMYEYNKNDVLILEDVFDVFRPYARGLPNMGVYSDMKEHHCPYCGSPNFSSKGYWFTPNGKYNSFRCECGGIFRDKENLLDKYERKIQKISI